MKKTISILIIVAMMLASFIAIIPVSAAPEGTAIYTAEDFAAMSPGGKYYLANDIVLSTSYPDFKGTLDGNGKTITVKGAIPVFTKLSGATVTNLNVVANFETDALSSSYGALANTANGNFYNINADISYKFTKPVDKNIGGIFGEINGNSNISECSAEGFMTIPQNDTALGNAVGTGGIVGKLTSNADVTISNCANYTNIERFIIRVSNGGIVGMIEFAKAKVENCVNYGDITTISGGVSGNVHCGNGGIVGKVGNFSNGNFSTELTVQNCRNYADITAKKLINNGGHDAMLGGIVGQVSGAKRFTVQNCVNSGKITHEAETCWSSTGGILGNAETYNYTWSPVIDPSLDIMDCVNIGIVSGGTYAGGMIGSALQMNSKNCRMVVYNCANYANVSSKQYAGGILGASGNGGALDFCAEQCYNKGNITANTSSGGIVGWFNATWDSGQHTADKTCSGTGVAFPVPSVVSCVNAGNAKMAIWGVMSGTTVNIKDCVNTASTLAIAPTDTSIYNITAPQNATAIKNEVLASVPGNTIELDKIIAEYADYTEDDFISGWDNFSKYLLEAELIVRIAETESSINSCLSRLNAAKSKLVMRAVDLTELDSTINAAGAYLGKETQYTPITWEQFEKAYAEALEAKTAKKMSTVLKATETLIMAISGLEKRPDLATLNATINSFSRIDSSLYTSASWETFSNLISLAKELKEDPNVTKAEVDDMIEQLNSARLALEEKVSPNKLKAYVEKVSDEYPADSYTSRSYATLVSALRRANDAISENDMSQEDVDKHIENITAAIEKLEVRATFEKIDAAVEALGYGDIIENASLLEIMRRDHLPENWDGFNAVVTRIRKAKTPSYMPTISAADEEDMVKCLNEAYAKLTRYARYTEIDNKLFEVSQLKETDYTAESWQELAAAVYACNQLKSDRNTTQVEADAALEKLNAAVDSLVVANLGDIIEVVDIDTLMQKLIDAKNKYSPEDYTEESYKLFNEIANSINGAVARGELTEEEIKDYSKRLDKAIDSLEKAIKKGEIESDFNEYSDLVDIESLGCSGSIGTASIALVTVLALGATAVLKKKKED